MADVTAAIDFVLRQEDSTMTGKITNLPGDSGGATRFGLASHYHPELVASGYFDVVKTPRDAALKIAEDVYAKVYAAPLYIVQINDQALAAAVLSLGVNSGDPESAKLLQGACVSAGKTVTIDGHIGPSSLAAINAVPPKLLLALFCTRVRNFYADVVAAHPEDAGDLKGWMNRVAAWQTI